VAAYNSFRSFNSLTPWEFAVIDPVATNDPFQLNRFLEAQADDYDQALAELKGGRKQTHWMWYVFPQIEGLGSSPMAQRYAIQNLAEAKAYFAHPELGPRLLACAEAVLGIEGKSAHDILGSPDDLKLCSSATLFAAVSLPGSVFERLLVKYFGGIADERTLQQLKTQR
jgi:uncharacterized protein (DUF1810 family)